VTEPRKDHAIGTGGGLCRHRAGATGDTGRAAVREAIDLGLAVRAMVHSKDARSEALAKLGAEIVIGDLLDINTLRAAMEGVEATVTVTLIV
jgi:NAD(P)H dehydrogenase (quinone)